MRFTLLRAFVALALLANVAYAAWSTGALRSIGLAPANPREPARHEQQVRPEVLRVLSPAAAASAVAQAASAAAAGPVLPRPEAPAEPASQPGSAPTTATSAPAGTTLACLEIGPLDGANVEAAERALAAALPGRSATPQREVRPAAAQYAVFVGPVLSREAARLRREELVKLKLSYEAIELPAGRLGPERQGGYSLGRHDSEGDAAAALASMRERGLRGGRVVLVREAGAPRTWLRVDRLDAPEADAVRALPAVAVAPWTGARASDCLVGSVMSVGAPR